MTWFSGKFINFFNLIKDTVLNVKIDISISYSQYAYQLEHMVQIWSFKNLAPSQLFLDQLVKIFSEDI